MDTKSYSLISDMKNSFVQWTIKVRVMKFWEGSKNGVPTGLDYVFVDEKANRIHGKVLKTNREKFSGRLEEQKIYILTRVSIFKPELKYRPTRHEFMAVLNADTGVRELSEVSKFPKYSFDFIKLNSLAQHDNNNFLNDVIGIFIDSSETQKVNNDKILREIWIKDETDANVRVVLWGDMAINFAKPANLTTKPIFILSSTSVDFYKGTNKYSINSRPSSNYYFDLDIPEARFLKNSEIEIGNTLERGDWTTSNRKTIIDMLSEYEPDSKVVYYSCIANIRHFEGKYTYPACTKCNKKAIWCNGNLKCAKCIGETNVSQAIVIRLRIGDNTGTCVVSLFGDLAAKICGRELQEILEFEQIGVRLDDLFDESKMKEFIVQIKMSTYQEKMSLSVTKLQVLGHISDINVEYIDKDTAEIPYFPKMVKIKQEKFDDNDDGHLATNKSVAKSKLSKGIANYESQSTTSTVTSTKRRCSNMKGKQIAYIDSPIALKGECSRQKETIYSCDEEPESDLDKVYSTKSKCNGGPDSGSDMEDATPIASFKEIVKNKRKRKY